MRKLKEFTTLFSLLFTLGFALSSCSPQANRNEIVSAIGKVLYAQEEAWNDGNLDDFMLGYWHSDSLTFVNRNGIQKGWERALNAYKVAYPTRGAMGHLQFDIFEIDVLSHESAHVIGKFTLEYEESDDVSGLFTLVFKRLNKQWLIVVDHTG